MPEQVELMDTDIDIIEKNAEKELVNKIRTDYFKRKAREEREKQAEGDGESTLYGGGDEDGVNSVGESRKHENPFAGVTFDDKGRPLKIKQPSNNNSINSNASIIHYQFSGTLMEKPALRKGGRKASIASVSTKKYSMNESQYSLKSALAQAKELTETAMKSMKKPDLSNNIEIM